MIRISNNNETCQHEWRYHRDGWVEECMPAICIKCGATGCLCDVVRDCGGWENRPPRDAFFGEVQKEGE